MKIDWGKLALGGLMVGIGAGALWYLTQGAKAKPTPPPVKYRYKIVQRRTQCFLVREDYKEGQWVETDVSLLGKPGEVVTLKADILKHMVTPPPPSPNNKYVILPGCSLKPYTPPTPVPEKTVLKVLVKYGGRTYPAYGRVVVDDKVYYIKTGYVTIDRAPPFTAKITITVVIFGKVYRKTMTVQVTKETQTVVIEISGAAPL